jgi:hypothetical protein
MVFTSLISESLKGSAGRREGLARGARKVEEEEELDEGGGDGGAETTTGGAAPADGGQPERVRSEAKEVEIFPRGKERSGETAGAVRDATDARGGGISENGRIIAEG